MKKNISNSLVDEHLKSIEGMKAGETDEFFYTRLIAKLAAHKSNAGKISSPWVYATVALLLVILAVNISAWRTLNVSNRQDSSLQQLVRAYGWTSPDLYSANSN